MNARVSMVDDRDLTLEEATAIVGRAVTEACRLGITVSVAVCGPQRVKPHAGSARPPEAFDIGATPPQIL